mgnify:CR=1 FL=1
MSHRKAFRLLIAWILLLGFLYSTLSIVRHNHFQSGGFDLGIYDQAVWQYSRFQTPYNTIKERFILGDHLTLSLALLAPLYWLWSDARMLLIFQAFWLSFSALAIYKVAILRLTTITRPRYVCQWIALCFAVVYSLFYGIQYAVFFDFHPVAIGVGLLPWIAYFLESKRRTLMWIVVALLLLTQENMGLALAGLGLIYVFQKQYRRTAALFIIGGILASFVAMKVVAAFSPIGFEYQPVFPKTIVSFVQQFFDQQEKRQSWFFSFSWFSFLPFLSPGALLAVVLDLSQYFATGPALARMWSPFTHHRAILAPFLALGVLEGLRRIRGKRGITIAVVLLLSSAVVQQYVFHYPLNKLTKGEFWKEEMWMKDDRELLRLVPPDASVATQQNLVPHLSHRKEIYLLYPILHDFDDQRCGKPQCWWLDFAGKPDYLVVDTRPNQWLTQILETSEHYQEAIANMEKTGNIQLMEKVGMARIYQIRYN